MVCSVCGYEKSQENFAVWEFHNAHRCKECKSKRRRELYTKNLELSREKQRESSRKWVKRAHLSGVCIFCGKEKEDEKRVLCAGCGAIQANQVLLRKRENKRWAIDFLGGCCQRCGLKDNVINVFDFHHLDMSTKERGLSKMFSMTDRDKTQKELEKCQLLCANCHRRVHAEE